MITVLRILLIIILSVSIILRVKKLFKKKVGDKMTTKEVSENYGICIATAARWAKNNGVQRGEIVNGIMPFNWTDEDCLRFEQRQSKGWKKGVPRHKD